MSYRETDEYADLVIEMHRAAANRRAEERAPGVAPHDACPGCGQHDVPPSTSRSGSGVVVGSYRCACGRTWATSWNSAAIRDQRNSSI